uniref:uncharacterized protein LOC123463342 n=1 Tax=Jaculus jaculus TaxID=51337 RepID=UPI001E1B0C41|nr:uncharacterized protein LOC123463342 [Jaculus jaculus]
MPGRCVGTSRSRRGVRHLRARRWGAGTSRRLGVRRRARSTVRETRGRSAEKLQDCRRPRRRRRPTTEIAASAGVNAALGTPGTAGSIEAAREPRAVWVNGAVGEPEVVGPAGAVWVTRSGADEAEGRSPRGCERKGRPGAQGHESILELWLKVQAMRVASGCWEGSRVELHPVPAGEGPVERGVPGRASWVETSRDGVTGPWVRGQVRTYPRASELSTVIGLRAVGERASDFGGQGQAWRAPPAIGRPGVVENIGCAVAPGPSERGQPTGVSGAMEWPEVMGGPRAQEVDRACGGAPGLCGGGQSVQTPRAVAQEAVCGDTPGLWERGQAAGVHDALGLPTAVEKETTPVDASGMWHRRQEVEDIGTGGIPDLWGTGQPVGVPCVSEGGVRSGGDPGSWGAAQTPGLSGSGEQEAGCQGVRGVWNIEQAMGAPRALGKEADGTSVPGLWGTGQLRGVCQTLVVPENRKEETRYSRISDLSGREQALAMPLAEAVSGLRREDTHSGNVLNHWERRQAMREQETPGPAPVNQDAGCRAVSCLCGRRQAVGEFEAVIPQHRCASVGMPVGLAVPAAICMPGLMCHESGPRDDVNLSERACAAPVPVASGRPVASEEQWSVVGNTGTGAFPISLVRRSAVGVPIAPEAPGFLEVEIDSEGFSGLSDRRQTARIPVTVGTSSAGRGPVSSRTSRLVQEEIGSGRVLDMVRSRPAAVVSMAMGVPESLGEEALSEGLGRRQSAEMPVTSGLQRVGESDFREDSGIAQSRQTTDVPIAARVLRPVEVKAGSESVSGLCRRHCGTVSETVRGTLPQEMLASVGVSMAGCVPATMWVTGSPREEADEGASGQTVVRRESTEEAGASGEEMRGRGILGQAGRGHTVGVSYTHGHVTRRWGDPRSTEEETVYENIPGVSGTRMAGPLVSRGETRIGHFRDHLQQSERRPVGGVPAVRVRGDNLGENYVGEGRLREAFH